MRSYTVNIAVNVVVLDTGSMADTNSLLDAANMASHLAVDRLTKTIKPYVGLQHDAGIAAVVESVSIREVL